MTRVEIDKLKEDIAKLRERIGPSKKTVIAPKRYGWFIVRHNGGLRKMAFPC